MCSRRCTSVMLSRLARFLVCVSLEKDTARKSVCDWFITDILNLSCSNDTKLDLNHLAAIHWLQESAQAAASRPHNRFSAFDQVSAGGGFPIARRCFTFIIVLPPVVYRFQVLLFLHAPYLSASVVAGRWSAYWKHISHKYAPKVNLLSSKTRLFLICLRDSLPSIMIRGRTLCGTNTQINTAKFSPLELFHLCLQRLVFPPPARV